MNFKTVLMKKDILVLFACVVFVTFILGAVGNRGRHHAQMILCQANQATMVKGVLMYAEDYYGSLFEYGYSGGLWMEPLADYVNKDEVRYCPATKIKVTSQNMYSWGSSSVSWKWHWDGMSEPEYGSYAFNSWFYTSSSSNNSGKFEKLYNVQFRDLTPLFADSLWLDGGVSDTDYVPADFELSGNPNYGGRMSMLLVDRHFDRINVSFVDGHVGAVELKDLWSLTWNSNWTRQYNMTRVDGSPIYPQQ